MVGVYPDVISRSDFQLARSLFDADHVPFLSIDAYINLISLRYWSILRCIQKF